MGQAGWGRAGYRKLGRQGGWVKPRPLLKNVVVVVEDVIVAVVIASWPPSSSSNQLLSALGGSADVQVRHPFKCCIAKRGFFITYLWTGASALAGDLKSQNENATTTKEDKKKHSVPAEKNREGGMKWKKKTTKQKGGWVGTGGRVGWV